MASGKDPSQWQALPVSTRLRELWDRWSSIVTLFARRHASRKWVSLQQYEKLHAELLGECRKQAEENEELRDFCHYLVDLIQPWLTCQTFTQADREILADLLARCEEITECIHARSWWKTWRRRLKLLLIVGGPAFLLLVGIIVWVNFRQPISDWLMRASNWIRVSLNQFDMTYRLILGGLVSVIVVMFLLSRMRNN